LRATRVNADPIWGLSLATGLTALTSRATPLCECRDPDGFRHELGAIDDAPTLADGHHRFETALNYRNEMRVAGEPVGGADAIMMLVVELVDDELCIEPIHRMVDLPPGIDLRDRLGDAFTIHDAGPNTAEGVDALETAMREQHGLGIVDGRGLALAVPRPDVRAAALAGEHPDVAATDAAVIEAMVVPRLAEATWQYRAHAADVAALVEKGVVTAAILCSPVSVAETRAAAVDRVRMPQKTTFFWPKPRTGMVFRALDD
jgi:uncharacterized protein (DUF1015 family)